MVNSQRDTVPLVVIYPYLDAGEYSNRLIGSVVKYPDMPIERYIPSRSTKQASQIIPTLNPKPSQIRNVGFLTHGIKDVHVSSMVNEILEGFFGSSNTNATTLARIWHMSSPDKNFKELLENKAYFKQLFNLLKSSQDEEGYFITDIVTLVDITEQSLGLHGRYTGASPLSNSLLRTQTGPLGQQQAVRDNGYSQYVEGELIICLGYRRVKLEKVNSLMAMIGRLFQGQGYGYTARLGLDYQPQEVQTPTNITGSDEHAEIIRELGFDVKIVG
jgi:hypothetical protein